MEHGANERIILEGDLSSIMLPDVLTFLTLIKKSGALALTSGGVEKTVYWQGGEVVFATSTLPQDALGPFLLRNGRITEAQYRDSVDLLTPGRRHGKLLVQLGVLSPKELWWGVKNQVLEIIYSLFQWRNGRFQFAETEEEFPNEKITLSMNTTNIIMEGIRRLDEWQRIKEKISSSDAVFQPTPVSAERLESLRLPDIEREVLAAVDGSRTVRELVRLCGATEFETFRILYSLAAAHVIEESGESKPRSPIFFDVEDSPELLKVAHTYNTMFEHLHTALVAAKGEDDGRRVFLKVLESAQTNELFAEIDFDEAGRFNENLLIANISELPFEDRKAVLDEGLNTLLSFQLFEINQHLDTEAKSQIYRFILERKRELD